MNPIRHHRVSRTLAIAGIAALAATTVACGDDGPEADTVTLVTYSSFPVEGTGAGGVTWLTASASMVGSGGA